MEMEMEPLACLKYLTKKCWPAQYPSLSFIWNRELSPYVADPSLLSRLRWIICADNPGEEEAKHGRFLAPTGDSGKAARTTISQAGFDWKTQVIVLNKSVIHTPKTIGLKALPADAVRATEEVMIHVIFDLLARTEANLWIVGLGGCDSKKPGWPRKLRRKDGYPAKFITPYFFAALRDGGAHFKERIFISKHFSRGAFTSEMNKLPLKGSLKDRLAALPHATRLFAQGLPPTEKGAGPSAPIRYR